MSNAHFTIRPDGDELRVTNARPEVFRDRGHAHVEGLGELAHRAFTRREPGL